MGGALLGAMLHWSHEDKNMNVNYIVAKDNKDLEGIVTKAIASYGRGRLAVQKAIIACLIHAAKHGDYRQASTLAFAIGGKTGQQIVTFFQDFGGLSRSENADQNVEGFNQWQGKDHIIKHLDEAKATMFWEWKTKKEPEFKAYTTEQLAKDFLESIQKARKKAAQGKASFTDELTDQTRQAVLRMVRFEAVVNQAGEQGDKAQAA